VKLDVLLGYEPAHAAHRAAELESAGVDGVFTFENAHDVFFPLVLAAGAADVDLMTNVAIAFPRSPVHLAHAAYDLQLLSGGRFRLGLGSQVRAHIVRRYGSEWSRPVARMRETVAAIKAVFDAWERREPLDFHGEFGSHTLMPPAFDPGPNPFGPPPVLVGALGPKMTEMAAATADGLLMMPFNSARHLEERTVPAIERGLASAQRAPEELTVVAEVIVAMGTTDEALAAARDGVRFLLAFYGSTPAYRPVLEVEGWEDRQPQLQQMTRRGEWSAMPALVDDEMVDRLAVAGTPQQCAEQIAARFGAVASRVCAYFPGYPAADADIAALAEALHAAPDVSGGSTSP
jgi:probable F420-dependent oxidoreductase